MPPLAVTDLQGKPATISDWQVRLGTLIYVYRPSCIWCRRNESLARGVEDRYRIIGLSLSANGLTEYLARTPLPFPSYVIAANAANDYKSLGTPETLFVAPRGHLVRRWS